MFALMLVAVASMIAGTAITAYGQYAQGQAQKKMYDYQAAVAERQADMEKQAAETNVKLTQSQAMRDTQMLQKKYMLVEGAQKAAFAASGVGGGSVTEGDIATDTFNTRKLDEDMIRHNADLKSWAIKNQSEGEIWGLKSQKEQYTFAGKNAAAAGTISSVGTIFSGAGQIASSAYMMKK